MISKIQERPQSKHKNQLLQRPPTRNVNLQQAQKCYLMARQHQTRKQYTNAIKHYAEAVMHNPQHYQAYCNVGIIYRDLQNFKQAINSYQKALSIKGDDYKTIYNLANAYRLIGDPEKACQLYTQVIEKGDVPNLKISSINNMGICYQDMFKFQNAIDFYEKVIAAQPNYQGGHYNKAVCLVYLVRKMDRSYKTRLLKISQAEKLFSQVVQEINPNNIMAKVYLEELKYLAVDSKQTYQSCMDEMKAILQKEKQNGKMTAAVQDQINRKIGVCLAGLQRYQESAIHFKDGVKDIKKDVNRKSSMVNPNSKVEINLNEYDTIKQEPKKKDLNGSNPIQKQTDSNYMQSGSISMVKKGSTGSNIFNVDQQDKINKDMSPLRMPVKVTSQRQLTKSEVEEQQLKIKEREQQQNRSKQAEIIRQIQSFLNEKKYEKAAQLLKQLPQGKVRSEQKIIILSKQAQFEQNPQHASYAIETYKFGFLVKNPKDKSSDSFNEPQAKDVSVETHQAIAQCYTLLGQHKKSIIHYGYVNNWYQQNHKLDEKYVESQSAISLNYQHLGLFDQAMACYKKALKMNPNNFELNYNLANCYQEANMIDEAIASHKKCLSIISQTKKKTTERNLQWFKEGDIHLNMSICYGILMSPRDQLASLEKAMNIFDENCSSIQQLLENYDKSFLLDIYLQLANLYEASLEQNRGEMSSEQLQKTKQKLLSTYLVLLQFQECPDRLEIILNCGNILYQQKLYVNALQYYKQLDQSDSSNYLGVTNLRINQFTLAYAYLANGLKEQPQNNISHINFALIDWVFGGENPQALTSNPNDKKVTAFQEEFPYQCDHLFEYRFLFTIQFIDQLTYILSSEEGNKMHTPIEECNTVIKSTILSLRKSLSVSNFQKLNPQFKAKIKTRQLIFSKLDEYNKSCKQNSQRLNKVLITQEHVDSVIKPSENLAVDFKQLVKKLKQLSQTMQNQQGYFPSIVQTMMTLFIVSNRKQMKSIGQLLKGSINPLHSPNLYEVLQKKSVEKISAKQKLDQNYLQKITLLQNVLLPNFVQEIQEWDLKAQAKYSPLYELIKQIYWESLPQWNIKYISYPYKVEWNIPKSEDVFQYDDCMLKLATIMRRVFGKQQDYERNLSQSKKNTIKGRIKQAIQKTYQSNEVKKNQNGQFEVVAGQDFYPLTLHLYYQNAKLVSNFVEKCLKRLNSNSEIKTINFVQSLNKENESEAILINNLIKVEFHVGQRDFISEYCEKALQFPLGIETIALMTIDGTDKISFPNSAKEGWFQQYKRKLE